MKVNQNAGPSVWSALKNQLEDTLLQIEKDEPTVIKRASRSLQISNDSYLELQNTVDQYQFEEGEEVQFYKHISPFFISRIYYNARLFKIETEAPPYDAAGLQQYYRDQLSTLNKIYNDHRFISHYIESGATNLDLQLFTRPDHLRAITPPDIDTIVDGARPMCYDIVIAILIAADLLKRHIYEAMADLILPGHAPGSLPKIIWTAPKAHLVELGYLLKAARVFNNGNASIKDIFECLETAVHAKTGNYGRTFQELLYRHAGPTAWQDSAKKDYLLFIQTLDDKHMVA